MSNKFGCIVKHFSAIESSSFPAKYEIYKNIMLICRAINLLSNKCIFDALISLYPYKLLKTSIKPIIIETKKMVVVEKIGNIIDVLLEMTVCKLIEVTILEPSFKSTKIKILKSAKPTKMLIINYREELSEIRIIVPFIKKIDDEPQQNSPNLPRRTVITVTKNKYGKRIIQFNNDTSTHRKTFKSAKDLCRSLGIRYKNNKKRTLYAANILAKNLDCDTIRFINNDRSNKFNDLYHKAEQYFLAEVENNNIYVEIVLDFVKYRIDEIFGYAIGFLESTDMMYTDLGILNYVNIPKNRKIISSHVNFANAMIPIYAIETKHKLALLLIEALHILSDYKFDKAFEIVYPTEPNPYKSLVVEQSDDIIIKQSNDIIIEQSNDIIIEQSNDIIIEQSNDIIIEQSNDIIIEQSNVQIIIPKVTLKHSIFRNINKFFNNFFLSFTGLLSI